MFVQKQVETWQAIDQEILGVQTCIPVQVVKRLLEKSCQHRSYNEGVLLQKLGRQKVRT